MGKLKDGLAQLMEQYKRSYSLFIPEYIGSECSITELDDVLSSGAYEFTDAATYENLIKDYCYANDGCAYIRVADMIEKVETDPALRMKLQSSRGMGCVLSSLRKLINKLKRRIGRLIR